MRQKKRDMEPEKQKEFCNEGDFPKTAAVGHRTGGAELWH